MPQGLGIRQDRKFIKGQKYGLLSHRENLETDARKPFGKFARMIDKHWDGIAAYCETENKAALGFVDGLYNKVRVIQRRTYGLRDEEYLRPKVLTCMLPDL